MNGMNVGLALLCASHGAIQKKFSVTMVTLPARSDITHLYDK